MRIPELLMGGEWPDINTLRQYPGTEGNSISVYWPKQFLPQEMGEIDSSEKISDYGKGREYVPVTVYFHRKHFGIHGPPRDGVETYGEYRYEDLESIIVESNSSPQIKGKPQSLLIFYEEVNPTNLKTTRRYPVFLRMTEKRYELPESTNWNASE